MSTSSLVQPQQAAAVADAVSALDISVAATYSAGGSEVVSVSNGMAFVTDGGNGEIDIFDAASGDLIRSLDLEALVFANAAATDPVFDGVQSVAAKNGIVAAAIARETAEGGKADGVVALFDTDGTLLNVIEVGNLPDMLTFTADGTRLLVANEGEPGDEVDPLGGVSIIDLAGGAAAATVTTLDFTAFDGQEAALSAAGVLLEPGKSVSEDLEPEYITVLPDGQTAWIALQEANAYAVLDLTTNTITGIHSLGLVDRSLPGFELDASDRDDGINLANYDNLFGMRMPDAMASIEINGETYIFTANEGDARDHTEARIKDLDLDPTAFPDAEALQEDEVLGRLNVRSDLGDTDGDGDYDQLYTYGARSFTIFDTAGNVVFDSGSMFEELIAEIRPDYFNADEGEFDARSDNKGVEPEAIAVGEVNGRFYAFIGLERDNGVMIFDVTDPAAPTFDSYIEGDGPGNLAPEVIIFIPAEESTSGGPQIAVAYEVSGNTVLFDLLSDEAGTLSGTPAANVEAGGNGADTILGRAGDDMLRGNGGDDMIHGGLGDDTVDGGTGNDHLVGYVGDDMIAGGAGNDAIAGNSGNDTIDGGTGNDTIRAGVGDDVIEGGAGDDLIFGGFGADIFVFDLAAGTGADTIRGFEQDVDLIDIEGATFEDLVIEDVLGGVLISFEDSSILVRGQVATDFTAADFI